MADLEFAIEEVASTSNSPNIDIAILDSTHFVMIYTDGGNKVVVGEISNNTISFGTPVSCYGSCITTLDSTHFVVAYETGGDGYARVGSVSGTNITLGNASAFEDVEYLTLEYHELSVDALDSTHFVVIWRDLDAGDDKGQSIIGAVSGTTITSFGTKSQFALDTDDHICVAALDSTHFVVVYGDKTNNYYGTAKIGVVSGTTISSFGTAVVYNSVTDTEYNTVTSLDPTHFIVAYDDDYNQGNARVGTFSGTTISSFGTEATFNNDPTNLGINGIDTFDNVYFIVSYTDITNSNYGTAVLGMVNGTDIEFGDECVYNTKNSKNCPVGCLDSFSFIVAYTDYVASYRTAARVGAASTFTPQIIIS